MTSHPVRSLPVLPSRLPVNHPVTAVPIEASLRLFDSTRGSHLFVADGSRIYDLNAGLAQALRRRLSQPGEAANTLLADLQLQRRPWINAAIPDPPPVRAVSLNIAQACNLACTYCYADQGRFGGETRKMPLHIAQDVVDRLVGDASPGDHLLLGFMGGEPFLERGLIHALVPYAMEKAATASCEMRFSLTTNATLLQRQDVELLSSYPFQVQISLDGDRSWNDSLRPYQSGRGSYDRVLKSLDLFSSYGRPKRLSARATVTPQSRDLLAILDHLVGLGFDDVGFGVVLVSPDPLQSWQEAHFPSLLEGMKACARKTLEAFRAGRVYPFSNLLTAIEEIHRGSHRPYPCGAGAGYVSANAEGKLFACHRLIDDADFAVGDTHHGLDPDARQRHLERWHVDRQEPCRSCWARYLCGGGCYHEVSRRGRVACDYIRGWLDFCLITYVELEPEDLRRLLPGTPLELIATPATVTSTPAMTTCEGAEHE